MKNTWTTIAIIIILALGGWFIYSQSQITGSNGTATTTPNGGTQGGEQTTSPTTYKEVKGNMTVTVTDAAADMGNVSSITMTVSQVAVHTSGGSWTTVSTEKRDLDLLDLKAKSQLALVADATVPSGSYDQVRLTVDKVVVKKTDGATAEAKLPSNQLTIKHAATASADAVTNITLDVLADQSLHVTGNNEYVFAPVIKMESRTNADVAVDANGVATVSGGNVESSATVGMDLDGTVKTNFKLDTSTKLEIKNGKVLKLQGATSGGVNVGL